MQIKTVVLSLLTVALLAAAPAQRSFTGFVTDTMCGTGHVSASKPDPQGVRECVRSNPSRWKFGLAVGNDVYVLSDQKAGDKYAGAKVTVTGTLDEKTRTIQVQSITPAK